MLFLSRRLEVLRRRYADLTYEQVDRIFDTVFTKCTHTHFRYCTSGCSTCRLSIEKDALLTVMNEKYREENKYKLIG